MSALRPILIALIFAIPAACHDDREADHPTVPHGGAGSGVGSPAPATTNEPVVPGVPNASQAGPTLGPGPASTWGEGPAISQAMGGTNGSGGFGAIGGSSGVSTGGAIHY